jgi:hypothetical protein
MSKGSTLDLVFQGTSYPVAKRLVFDLLEHNQELMNAKSIGTATKITYFVDHSKSSTFE